MARITIEIEGSAEDISIIVELAIARGPRPETPLAIEDERPVELLAMEPVQEHRKKRESLYEIDVTQRLARKLSPNRLINSAES